MDSKSLILSLMIKKTWRFVNQFYNLSAELFGQSYLTPTAKLQRDEIEQTEPTVYFDK